MSIELVELAIRTLPPDNPSPEGMWRILREDRRVDEFFHGRPGPLLTEEVATDLHFLSSLQRWLNAVRWQVEQPGGLGSGPWKRWVKMWLYDLVGTSALTPQGQAAGFDGWNRMLDCMHAWEEAAKTQE